MRRSRTTLMLFGLLLTGLILAGCSSLSKSTDIALVPQITGGEPDGNDHPYVGLIVYYDAEGRPLTRCTGTLVAPKVVLTAAHCMFNPVPDSAAVWFDPAIASSAELRNPRLADATGTPVPHPNFQPVIPDSHDVGVILLKKPIRLDTYGALPELGLLDRLTNSSDLTVRSVGYGLQSIVPELQADLVRYTAISTIINLDSANNDGYNVQTSNKAGKGDGTGGQCFGDSGAPVFYPENSNVVIGVSSFGFSPNCTGNNDFSYRMDIADSQNFIGQFLD